MRIAAFFTQLVGPAAVMAAGTMGAGAIASFLLAGAWFRYDLLWVLLLIPALVVLTVAAGGFAWLAGQQRDVAIEQQAVAGDQHAAWMTA